MGISWAKFSLVPPLIFFSKSAPGIVTIMCLMHHCSWSGMLYLSMVSQCAHCKAESSVEKAGEKELQSWARCTDWVKRRELGSIIIMWRWYCCDRALVIASTDHKCHLGLYHHLGLPIEHFSEEFRGFVDLWWGRVITHHRQDVVCICCNDQWCYWSERLTASVWFDQRNNDYHNAQHTGLCNEL